jgi:hypothetical protein
VRSSTCIAIARPSTRYSRNYAESGASLSPLQGCRRRQQLQIKSGYRYCALSSTPDKIHAERLIHKLDTFTDHQRAAQQQVRSLNWQFYADLKDYRM